MDNGQSVSVASQNTVTITTTPVVTSNTNNTNNSNSSTINASIITTPHNTTPQQLHIQTTPIQSTNNNNNTVTINANNGIKKKRFSVNIVNVKPSGAESSNDVETHENAITFTPSVAPPSSVKEESVTPWQTVTEAIQEIPADYVDQTRESIISLCCRLI